MPSPFPGMDPYLEGRDVWPDVHHRLITVIGDALAPQVAPRYYVRIDQRTYTVREGYVEIRAVQTHEIITAIEVISPTNKAAGEGREQYEAKRRHVLQTMTNLVEIDLLRAGAPMAMDPSLGTDYRIIVASGWERPRAALYGFGLRQPLPTVPVPLRWGEKEAELPLGQLLSEIYDRARYDLSVDYRRDPEPPLASEDTAWAGELLRTAGRRG